MNTSRMLRTLSTLLCLLMLTAALAACGTTPGTGEDTTTTEVTTTTPEVKTISINVADYTLVRPESTAQTTIDAAVLLNKAINEKTGANFANFTDDFVRNESEVDPNAHEILIGATNRPESSEALKDVSFGYIITKIGNKIVINATVSSLINDAVTYFIDTYVTPSAANGTFSIPEELHILQSSDSGVTLLDDNNKSKFKIVFNDSLDNTKSTTNEKDRTDWVVKCALDFRSEIMREFEDVNFALNTDWVGRGQEPDETSYEILVGRTNRQATQTFLEQLAYNEYGFAVIGNKIVISGWSDLTIGLALDLFSANIDDYIFTDANGNKNLAMMEGTKVTKTFDNWNVDIPAYDGGVFTGVMEGLDSCYELYITETNPTEYKAYRAKLEGAGYKLQQENEINNNLFATYYNDKTMIHAYYVEYLSAVRIVTEKMTDTTLPELEDPYTKITDTTFTMMDLDYEAGNFGNAFIITLEDGSFIVHDGGGTSGQDKAELYNVLKKLNKRSDGKIRIAAWILSHEHWDHFKNFYDFCQTYSSTVVLEEIIYNVARPTINYNSNNPGSYVSSGNLKGLSLTTGAKLTKIHTGQKVQVRNLTIECLYTQEDLYPTILHTFNDSCIVTRFTIDGQMVTILGDIEDEASAIMVDMYDEASLRTDMLQVAHHGWGATTPLYNLFKPTVLIWPTDQKSFTNQTAGTSSSYYYAIDYALFKQKNVQLVIVADGGHKTFPLPMKNISESSITVWEPSRK